MVKVQPIKTECFPSNQDASRMQDVLRFTRQQKQVCPYWATLYSWWKANLKLWTFINTLSKKHDSKLICKHETVATDWVTVPLLDGAQFHTLLNLPSLIATPNYSSLPSVFQHEVGCFPVAELEPLLYCFTAVRHVGQVSNQPML